MNANQQQGPIPHPLELWGGVESTVNRVGELYYDQLVWNGHDARPDDLARFAELGIQAIRYPVLWERTAPDGPERPSWQWSDQRLRILRSLNIRPIVGLLHHGSGPRHTSLLDPEFPRKLAQYARSVAERYPWVAEYTPINEPLTTARFSGLYGHWYPHLADPRSFMRMLINEVRGIQEAMCAIWEVNPEAQLVQTEDLGKIYSAPALSYQADHENERRWLTFDLLCGRVDRTHPLYQYVTYLGISEQELGKIQANAIAPDMLGINYYVTSERYLDDRLDLFPSEMHGGNGRHGYVDIEAARMRPEAVGHAGILQEAWDRYRLPLGLTEVHLGDHREQQLRWWLQAWRAVETLRSGGADVRAITAWALLGSFHWNNLVTRDDGVYESGVFDTRGPTPRPTLLARAIGAMARAGVFDHPVVDGPGWWQSPRRFFPPPVGPASTALVSKQPDAKRSHKSPRRVLITGANGTLGQAFQRACEAREVPFLALPHGALDIADERAAAKVLAEVTPWAIINAGGYVRVDEAEREPEACLRANALGPATLARLSAERGAALLSFSSDLVFDGAKRVPYVESDQPSPLNAYGVSKAAGERRIQEANPAALIVRTAAFFGPEDQANFLAQVAHRLLAQQEFAAAEDVVISPTYVPDLVNTCLDLLMDGEHGIWHLANQGQVSWSDFAERYSRAAGLDDALIRPAPIESLGFTAARPHYSVLGSERGLLLPSLDDAIFRYARMVVAG